MATRKLFLGALLATALVTEASASTKTYYHRLDARIEARAEALLEEQGLSEATVRSHRGRLVVYGEFGERDLDGLRRLLKAESGARTVTLP